MITPALALLVLLAPYADCLGGPAERVCIERRRAHDRGDFPRMFELVDREIDIARLHRLLSPAPTVPGARRPLCQPIEAAFVACNEQLLDLDCADRRLDDHVALGCLDDPTQRARHDIMQAMRWRRRQDPVAAMVHLVAAEAEARETDDLHDLADSLALQAELAAHLGQRTAVRHLLAELDPLLAQLDIPARAHAVARTRNVLAWALLLAGESDPAAADPRPLLLAALPAFTEVRPNRSEADNVRLNLALAELQRGDLAAVRTWLDAVDTGALGDEGLLWLRLIEVRAALAVGDLELAARRHDQLAAVAARTSDPMAAWFVAWTQGMQLEAQGRPDLAIEAYARAEDRLESLTRALPGPAAVQLADRRPLSFADGTRRLIRAQLAAGAVDDALERARDARSRALRAVAPRCTAAGRSRDDLPAPGVLRLLYVRVTPRDRATGRAEWIGFARTHARVHARPLELPEAGSIDLARWSDALLAPFADELADARAVEVLATEELHDIPFHALPWRGGLLLERVTVRFDLDLGPCDASPGRAALVVHGDDPTFTSEVRAVQNALAAVRPVTALRPARAHELDALFSADLALAHVVAHGVRTPGGELLFAADHRLLLEPPLTREAILVAPHVPGLVYLSACTSSFVDAETLGGGLGLAHAFLLRGARHVVGAVDRIDATVTERFAVRFYEALAVRELDAVPDAWRAAYLKTRAELHESLEPDLRMLRLYAR